MVHVFVVIFVANPQAVAVAKMKPFKGMFDGLRLSLKSIEQTFVHFENMEMEIPDIDIQDGEENVKIIEETRVDGTRVVTKTVTRRIVR